MKIRNGFVSNSSSSSFCIIGVDYSSHVAALIKAEGLDFGHYNAKGDWEYGKDCLGYGVCQGKIVEFYGNSEPQYAGVDAKPFLEKRTLQGARKAFQTLVKKFLDVEIPLRDIDIHYGEAGEG